MVIGTDATDEPAQQGRDDSGEDEKQADSVPPSSLVKRDDPASPPTPAVLGPTGKPDEVTHAVGLDLLNVTKDLLVALVDVIESGSNYGAHTIIGWRDGSSSAIWEKNEAPAALRMIEQVDQIAWVHAYAHYVDGSSLHLRLMSRHQQAESIAESENSEAQQRLYRIRNLAQATDIPRNSSLPPVYRHRLAAIYTLVGVSLSASILGLVSVFIIDNQPIITWSLIAAQFAAIGGVLLLHRKWPLARPAPDAVVLRHSASDERSSESWITYTTLVATVVAGIATVIQLFR